jgi:hypothetical protein
MLHEEFKKFAKNGHDPTGEHQNPQANQTQSGKKRKPAESLEKKKSGSSDENDENKNGMIMVEMSQEEYERFLEYKDLRKQVDILTGENKRILEQNEIISDKLNKVIEKILEMEKKSKEYKKSSRVEYEEEYQQGEKDDIRKWKENQVREQRERSYANITRTKKMVEDYQVKKMITNPALRKPVDFTKMYIQINVGQKWKRAERKDKVKLARQIFKTIGIEEKVREFSFIGNSVLELYVANPVAYEVSMTLKANECLIINDYNASVGQGHGRPVDEIKECIISRVGFLYARNNLVKLKEAILDGFEGELRESIINKAIEIQKTFTNRNVEIIKKEKIMSNESGSESESNEDNESVEKNVVRDIDMEVDDNGETLSSHV